MNATIDISRNEHVKILNQFIFTKFNDLVVFRGKKEAVRNFIRVVLATSLRMNP